MVKSWAFSFVLLLGCLGAAAAGDKAILHVYTWSDYFAPDVLAAFEDEHDCHVAIDVFDSNEAMLEALEAGGTVYDVVTPSSYMAAAMERRGMLLGLDHARLPDLGNLDKGFSVLTEDPEMRYSVPYTRTVTGVGYNRARLGAVDNSWAIFGRTDLTGRMTMLDDMRESIGAALKFLGHSLNSTDDGELAEAERLLAGWRKQLAAFEVDEANIGLGSGRYLAVHGYNGDLAIHVKENPDIDFFVPEEGASIASDDFVILAGTDRRELAHAFINHLLKPEMAALNMTEVLYYMPNPKALDMLDSRLKNNQAFSVPENTVAKCETIRDLRDATAKYEAVWERVKNAAE